MDFELTDDQRELQRVVRDIAERECPASLVREVVEQADDAGNNVDAGPARALWDTYVELDWPSLTVPEVDGGMGCTAVELVIVLEELGRVADPTPFLATTSQYLPLVRDAFASDDRATSRATLLAAVCAGGTGAAAFAPGTVRAQPSAGGGWTLAGTAAYVIDGDRADELAVVASTDDGPGVFVVPRVAARATRTPSFDASLRVAEVELDGVVVEAERAAIGEAARVAAARGRDEAVAGLAAATVGASQRVFDIALGHLKDRKQFGVPIGSFQALKHMAVDVYVAIERARSLVHFAGLTIAEDDPRRTVAASMAKAAAGDAQRIAARHGVQFFGGLGFTWENDLQLFVRRAKAGELLLGTAAEHRALVARHALGDHAMTAAEAAR